MCPFFLFFDTRTFIDPLSLFFLSFFYIQCLFWGIPERVSVFYHQALRGIPLGWRLGRDCGYIEIGLFPYFLDVNRKRNFFELVDELVDRTLSNGFRSLRCSWIDQVTIKAARSVCNKNPGADKEGGGPWGAQSCRWKMPSNSSVDRWRNPLPSALAVGVLPPNSLRDTPRRLIVGMNSPRSERDGPRNTKI